jgi:outer membrane lipoprotein SlyB
LPRLTHLALAALLAPLVACSPDYSPNTYESQAAQQANKVERGVIIGVREVKISADATLGTATGGAAGGIAGAQTPGGVGAAFGALGGALVGGLVGSAAQHGADDTKAWEYIVQSPKGDLVSVTQADKVPLKIGTKVLVIAGKQARIVPDYTVPDAAPGPAADSKTTTAPNPPKVVETPLPAPGGAAAQAVTPPDATATGASAPPASPAAPASPAPVAAAGAPSAPPAGTAPASTTPASTTPAGATPSQP